MKRRINTLVATLGLALILGGCGTKSMVVLVPDPDGHVGQVVVANEGGQQIMTEANQAVLVSGRKNPPSAPTSLSSEEVRATFAEALAAQPRPPIKFILHFLQDSNELTGESRAVLPQIIQSIQARGSTDIFISGHTDTTGAQGYNHDLSLERAKVLAGILVANGAVPGNITVTSHGEGNPLVKTADEVAEPRNRRVEVAIR